MWVACVELVVVCFNRLGCGLECCVDYSGYSGS